MTLKHQMKFNFSFTSSAKLNTETCKARKKELQDLVRQYCSLKLVTHLNTNEIYVYIVD